jgi:ketosteroid isomerase-like protein
MAHDTLAPARQSVSHLTKRYHESHLPPEQHGALEYQPLFDLLAPDATFKVSCPPDVGLWGAEVKGKEAILQLFEVDDRTHIEWLIVEQEPDFLVKGDRAVVLSEYSYKLRATGQVVRSEIALVIDFRDGMIARMVEIQDMSEWVYLFRTGKVA